MFYDSVACTFPCSKTKVKKHKNNHYARRKPRLKCVKVNPEPNYAAKLEDGIVYNSLYKARFYDRQVKKTHTHTKLRASSFLSKKFKLQLKILW